MNLFKNLFTDISEIKSTSLMFILVLIFLSFIFYYILIKYNKSNFNPKILVYASICISMSFVLSYIRIFHFPQGGAVTLCSMLPIMIFSYIFGVGRGIIVGFVYSLLMLIQDMYVVHPAQLLFDYSFAFSAIGLTGTSKKYLPFGILIGGFSRFFFHFISGVIFFGSYAPEGQNVFLYSFIINISIIGTDTIICFLVSLIPTFKTSIDKLKYNLNID